MSVIYEDILEIIGGFGRYQLFFYFWVLITWLHDSSALAFMVFGGITPTPINCTDLITNSSWDITLTKDNASTCFRYQFKSLNMEWNLVGPRRTISPLIISVQMAGAFFGPILFGKLADVYGRKKMCIIAISGLSVTGVLCGLSVNWQMFAAFRFFHGLFLSGGMTSNKTLLVETMVQRWRLINYFLGPMLGYLFLAGLGGICTDNWRELQFFSILPTAVSLLLCLFGVHESPKWLLQTGRTEAALLTLKKIGLGNRADLKDLPDAVSNYSFATKKYQLWYVFHEKRSAIQAIVLAYSWVVMAAVYYGLIFNLNNVKGKVAVNFATMMGIRLVVNSAVVPLDRYTKMGRRMLHQMGLWIVGILMLIMATFLGVDYLRNAVPILARIPALVGAGFSGFLWAAVDMYAMELFPTAVRAAAHGFMNSVARIGSIVAPQICLLTEFWVSAPYAVFLTLIAVNSILAYCFLPETKGSPLPDFHEAPTDTEDEFALADTNL